MTTMLPLINNEGDVFQHFIVNKDPPSLCPGQTKIFNNKESEPNSKRYEPSIRGATRANGTHEAVMLDMKLINAETNLYKMMV